MKTQSAAGVAKIRARVQVLLQKPVVELDTATFSDPGPIVTDFLAIARMVTLSDVTRRKRNGTVYLRKSDSRAFHTSGLEPLSVDAIVTSPPYAMALDYMKTTSTRLTPWDAGAI